MMPKVRREEGAATVASAALFVATLLVPLASPAEEAGVAAGTPGYRAVQISPLQLVEATDARRPARTDEAFPDRPLPAELGAGDRERILRLFNDAFEAELKDIFQVTSEPGPQTLRLESLLVGVEVDRRKWLAPATRKVALASTVTLVVSIKDSITGEMLKQLAIKDGPVANRLEEQSAAIYWDHLRRLFRRLAIRTRWLLAEPPEATP